jgi:hypothetical protein
MRRCFRFRSEKLNRSKNLVLLASEKKVFSACIASKRNSKHLKQKRTGNKQNEAKRKRTEKLLNQEIAEGHFYTLELSY